MKDITAYAVVTVDETKKYANKRIELSYWLRESSWHKSHHSIAGIFKTKEEALKFSNTWIGSEGILKVIKIKINSVGKLLK